MQGVTCNSWSLEKYGRFLNDKQNSQITKNVPRTAKTAEEDWLILDAKMGTLQLTLTDSNHLLITSHGKIEENVSLWDAQKWMTGIRKGDSMLLIVRANIACRKFRIKFSTEGQKTGVNQCKDCVKQLSPFFPFKVVPTPNEDEPEKVVGSMVGTDSEAALLSGDATIKQLTQALLRDGTSRLSLMSKNIDIPPEQLGLLVKLCLTDANFPGFVGGVEKELHNVMRETSTGK